MEIKAFSQTVRHYGTGLQEEVTVILHNALFRYLNMHMKFSPDKRKILKCTNQYDMIKLYKKLYGLF